MPGAKPWFNDEWTEERVERGKRLAADASSPDHAGTDLQHFLAQMEASEAVHRAFLAPTSRESVQHRGLAMYLRSTLHELMQLSTYSYCDPRVKRALETAVDQRVNLPAYTVGRKTPAVATLGLLAFASLRIVNESSLLSRPAEAQQQLLQSVALDHYLPDGLEDLEQYQRTALGLESPLTDKDLRVLLCLLRHKAATTLLSGRAGGVSLDPAMLEAQCSTAERLLEELLPGDASLLLRSALAKQPQCSPEATQACRAALQAAHAERAHFVAAGAALALAFRLFSGACGDWSLGEVQQLLDESEAELGFCKPWMMQAGIKAHGMQVAAARQVVARAVAQHPGKQRLPVALLHDDLDAMVHSWLPAIYDQPECSGCGRRSAQLRKCSRCRVAAYCSRDCQAKHWREGGHRQECARLASSKQAA